MRILVVTDVTVCLALGIFCEKELLGMSAVVALISFIPAQAPVHVEEAEVKTEWSEEIAPEFEKSELTKKDIGGTYLNPVEDSEGSLWVSGSFQNLATETVKLLNMDRP